jgi:hypothetical protein
VVRSGRCNNIIVVVFLSLGFYTHDSEAVDKCIFLKLFTCSLMIIFINIFYFRSLKFKTFWSILNLNFFRNLFVCDFLVIKLTFPVKTNHRLSKDLNKTDVICPRWRIEVVIFADGYLHDHHNCKIIYNRSSTVPKLGLFIWHSSTVI